MPRLTITPNESVCVICKQPIRDETCVTNDKDCAHVLCFWNRLVKLMDSVEPDEETNKV